MSMNTLNQDTSYTSNLAECSRLPSIFGMSFRRRNIGLQSTCVTNLTATLLANQMHLKCSLRWNGGQLKHGKGWKPPAYRANFSVWNLMQSCVKDRGLKLFGELRDGKTNRWKTHAWLCLTMVRLSLQATRLLTDKTSASGLYYDGGDPCSKQPASSRAWSQVLSQAGP